MIDKLRHRLHAHSSRPLRRRQSSPSPTCSGGIHILHNVSVTIESAGSLLGICFVHGRPIFLTERCKLSIGLGRLLKRIFSCVRLAEFVPFVRRLNKKWTHLHR
eukprot:SAG31_NODE_5554_length_2460_cov_3.027107_1_plen_104_part_00